jgi:4-amino-4-deoxy-L-arabinose transferase-like glycosyltransferase
MSAPERSDDEAAQSAAGLSAWRALPIAAAAAYAALALHAARVETPTADEFAHVPAGLAAWSQGRTDLYRSNPPLLKLALAAPLALDPAVSVPIALEPAMQWGPWEYGHRFMNANRDRYLDLMFRARHVSVLMALLAGWVVFRWAREVFGLRAAAVVTALFLLCPNVLAHGHLATIDMGAVATLALAAYALRTACRGPSWPRVVLAGAALGLALAVKFVALLLVPAAAIAIFAHRLGGDGTAARRAVAEIAALGAVAILVVNASVAFQGSFAPLGSLPARSEFATSLQAALPSWLPVPLPREYALGFDAAKEMQERGEFGSYLRGTWSAHGVWYYNFIALAVKLPLATLALLALAVPAWRRSGVDRMEAVAIGVPCAVLLAGFAGASHLNIGIRHVLPAFPFLFLLMGPIFMAVGSPLRRKGSLALAGVVLALAVRNVAAVHPDHLTYFNAAAGGPARGAEWLLDSNLDWGQDLYRVPAAVAELGAGAPFYLLYFGHVDPALYGIGYELPPPTPVEGIVAVSENFLGGAAYLTVAPNGEMTGIDGARAAWLRSYEPVRRLGSIVVYDTRRPPPP